jgi:hypothetical protein
MSSKHFSPRRPTITCILALSLSGCVAAPLAQMVVSQMAPAKPACAPGPGCQSNGTPGSFAGLSKGITDSFQKWTGGPSDTQTLAVSAPAPAK